VGDLLTFALRPGSIGPGRRFGLRRGTSATSWYDAGCRLEAGDPARAIAAYERALAGSPGFADAHNNLGRLHHDAGSAALAESCYRLAICAAPDIALYWFNLGVAVEDQGRNAEAIAAYERAIELDVHAADAHFNVARLLELAGRRAGDDLMLRRAVRHLMRYRDLTRRNVS
jgi:tetratricopeptide (TPR) repeat protein